LEQAENLRYRIARAGRFLAIRAAAAAFWIVVLLYVTPVIPWLTRTLTDRWEEPAGDILIVPGAEQLGDGTMGVSTYWRTLYAVRAWRTGCCKRIVFSGGKMGYPASSSLARSMADFAIGLGVPEQVILLEERASSTRENALFTAELLRLQPGSKVLMTSDYHMFRCRRAFEQVGLRVRAVPVPDAGKRWNHWPSRSECIWTVGGELAKLGYYRARGWI
jgi:uncharacterized SAM-binding protein YcdF (DUF218 family)